MSKHELPATLELLRGNVVLGTIEVNAGESELPWFTGAFHPAEEFELVRDLFDHELGLLRANTADDAAQWDDWEAVHAELHEPGLRLRSPDDS